MEPNSFGVSENILNKTDLEPMQFFCLVRQICRALTYLELLDVDTGVVGKTFCVCDLNVRFFQLISQIIPHLEEEESETKTEKAHEHGDNFLCEMFNGLALLFML